ncbi:hypothetical protein CCP3SC15_2340009 [Gammaproteobacteria bacterium]
MRALSLPARQTASQWLFDKALMARPTSIFGDWLLNLARRFALVTLLLLMGIILSLVYGAMPLSSDRLRFPVDCTEWPMIDSAR